MQNHILKIPGNRFFFNNTCRNSLVQNLCFANHNTFRCRHLQCNHDPGSEEAFHDQAQANKQGDNGQNPDWGKTFPGTHFRLCKLSRINCFIIIQLHGQVVINEICSRNAVTLKDNYNDYPDWIELYNKGTDIIELNDWSLSDDITEPEKWIFPDVVIYPDSYLVVFASGKDDKTIVDHWETIIHADNIWKYFTPFFEPDPAWKDPGFDDSSWMEGPGGFGRGDGDDNTVLPDSVATVYIRKFFNIVDTSLITSVLLQVDYDDAFVAYLNGVEIARSNIGWPGKIQNWDDFSRDVHPAVMFEGLPPEEFFIDIQFFKSIIIYLEFIVSLE